MIVGKEPEILSTTQLLAETTTIGSLLDSITNIGGKNDFEAELKFFLFEILD